jgi:hypothetical protein
MENKNSQMIRHYINLMESTEKNVVSESVITPLLTQTFKGFSKSVSLAVENSIKKVLDDVVLKSTGKVVAMNAIKNNANWKQAVIQSVEEAARARHKMSFVELSKKLPNEADKLVSEIDTILKKELDNAAKVQGKAISKDVKSSSKELGKTQTAKAAGTATKEDLKIATKNWDQNVKLQNKMKDAKRVLSGMPAITRKEVDKILKQAKTTTTTGTKISETVKGGSKNVKLPNSSGGGIFKLTKEQLAKLGPVTRVILSKGVIKSLIGIGISVGVIYLIYQELFPDNSIIIEDENGNDVDFGGSQFSPCVTKLITDKRGVLTNLSDGSSVVKVTTEEYPSGVYFYDNGNAYDVGKKVWGKWKCKGGQVVSENELNEQIDSAMSGDVDKMIDLLDFPVSQSDLKDAYTLLKKYSDSGNGRDFLNLYQQSGLGGGDLNKTLKYIYTRKAESVQYKNEIKKLINQIESGSGGTGSPSTGGALDDIEITWGGGKSSGGGRQTYRPCTDFPFTFGCKNEIIKEVQKCLGMEERHQTGNFGPITLNYLETKRGENTITKQVYDEIMKICKQTSTNNTDNENINNVESGDDLGIESSNSTDTNF